MNPATVEIKGLSQDEVRLSRERFGRNKIESKRRNQLLLSLKSAMGEPMLILLCVASCIYFIHGAYSEGVFLVVAIVLVYSISNYQESRSRNALRELRKLSQPRARVIRDNQTTELNTEEIVVGDFMIIEEGENIPADGEIIVSNDLSLNEAILTGESLPVSRNPEPENAKVFQGTHVLAGRAVVKVTQIGISTRIGQIGKSIEEIRQEKTPLHQQINDFVKKMAAVGVIVFIVIWTINIYRSGLVLDSLLNALTLAMSILPEEIPVAFATFMALGAWRLMQTGIIVKETKTVETLGSANVICVDKTGTITENTMTISNVYVHDVKRTFDVRDSTEITRVIELAMFASEPAPFDSMEKSIHTLYEKITDTDIRPEYRLVHEYPLSGIPPFMTHIFENVAGDQIVAAKGAPEAIIARCKLTESEIKTINEAFSAMTREGSRVLAVAKSADFSRKHPETQNEFTFEFIGLIAFSDPPKKNIASVMESFYKAGIDVKIITGDNTATATSIARKISFKGYERALTGEQLMKLSKEELKSVVANTNIFTRMFPEAKLKIIEALKENQKVVAMTGDGVNDGPALKAAHIGIAMGRRGSEVAKEASALILIDDDLSHMVHAVAMGRKIYNNLKKAIQYIISIHIPIILVVFIPLAFNWVYPTLFTPIHIIFLELIMGPTCSVIYENEPIEENLMVQNPRPFTKTFFNFQELSLSIVQGVMITAGLLWLYWKAVNGGESLPSTTAMVFVALITANIALTLVNRSFFFSIVTTIRYKNNMMPALIGLTILLTVLIFAVTPARRFFQMEIPSPSSLTISVFTGFISVFWFELYKWFKRTTSKL